MKQICFAGRTLEDLKQFPEDAMREAGYQLDRVQRGRLQQMIQESR